MTAGPDRDDLRDAVQRAAARRPGVVGGLVVDGEASVVAAGRTAAGGPVPTDRTLFEIGSVTKVFTALLLAEACGRGEVALETPLHDLVGEVRVPSRENSVITLRHLATHTSGLQRLPMPWSEVLRLTVTRHPDPYALLHEQDVLQALERTRLRRRPGQGRMHYSNFGAGLLGIALVRAAGAASYEELVRSRVCEPLGMHDTVVHRDADQLARSAQGHRGQRPAADWTFPGVPGAGALRSTAADLLRFARAQLEPDDHPLTDAIQMTQRGHGVARTTLGWLTHGSDPDRRVLWHNGGTGGFRSFVGLSPARSSVVVVLANSSRSVDATALRLLRPTAAP